MLSLDRRELLALLLGTLAAAKASAGSMRDTEGRAIAAFLNSIVPEDAQAKTLVVAAQTATTEEAFVGGAADARQLAAELPQATSAVIEDFLRVAQERTDVEIPSRLLRRGLRWKLAPESALDRIFETKPLGDAWRRFYREFPDASGLTRISRAGLDAESNQALFYLSINAGSLNGSGHFVLMQSRFGIWRLVATTRAWIS